MAALDQSSWHRPVPQAGAPLAASEHLGLSSAAPGVTDSLANVSFEKIQACPELSSEHQLCWGLLCSGMGRGTIVE